MVHNRFSIGRAKLKATVSSRFQYQVITLYFSFLRQTELQCITLKVQSHGAYDRLRSVCDLYKTSCAR